MSDGVPALVYLADHPGHVPTVVAWLRAEFGADVRPPLDAVGWERKVRGFARRDAPPIAFLALDGDGPAGTAVLVDDRVPDLPLYVPRLAFLYVDPAHRRRGLGAALTRRVEQEAARLGHRRLYLYATDQVRLYARLGWRVVERSSFDGEPMTAMAVDLHPTSRGAEESPGNGPPWLFRRGRRTKK